MTVGDLKPNKFATVGDRRYKERRLMSTVAVLHASQLVTLAGGPRPRTGAELSELSIVRDGGMLLRDGKIELAGPSDEIEKNLTGLSGQVSKDVAIIDASGRVVMPGFVDAHT